MDGARPRYSLRRRLVLMLVAVVGALWLVSIGLAFRMAHHEADELFDNQLRQTAETLLGIVAEGEVEHFAHEIEEHGRHGELPVVYEVWRVKGGERLLVSSPGTTPSSAPATAGFFEREEGGGHWRYFAAFDEKGRYRVVAGQDHADRYRLALELALHLMWPAVVGLPFMAAGIWWVVGRALRPVDVVAAEVAALDPQRLASVRTGQALPHEVAPLVDALNALIERVAQALDNERRFTADAAHELRTPLAALRVQAQVASRTADEPTRRHALAQVVSAVDRLAHLVEQLLTLARLDPSAGAAALERVDATAIATAVVAERVPQAARRGQRLELEAAPDCAIRATAAWFEVALRNLVDNAMLYAGGGARVIVRVVREADAIVVEVDDDGPGVAPERRGQLLGRFARGEAAAGLEGCGLGLSIVARIAELTGATLSLGEGLARPDGGHGLAARLRFPPARGVVDGG